MKKIVKNNVNYSVYVYVINGVPRYVGCGKNQRFANHLDQARMMKRYNRTGNGTNTMLLTELIKNNLFKRSLDFTVRRLKDVSGKKNLNIRMNKGSFKSSLEDFVLATKGKFGKESYLLRHVNDNIQIYSIGDRVDKDKGRLLEKKWIETLKETLYNIDETGISRKARKNVSTR